ncbi:MAG: exodeoxyribonuclease VII large subunit [Candidatus Geothermincolia bacterium]
MDDDELTLPWDESPADEEPGGEQPGEGQPEVEVVLTVSEVNRMAKHALERISVTVQGEVSGLNTRYPYYVYLNLRDNEATLPAIMQKRMYDALDFTLEEGASVVVDGMLTLFEKQGRFQVRVVSMRPFGEGALQRRIEMIKKKLQAEGLFDDARKRPLPEFPERIGVVTSPRGAAIRDVTVTLARRYAPARVFVRGVRVQGAGAVEQICAALHLFDKDFPVDVVILARGGGSIEDLEPFSTEEVARAVARMSVPVVTGIGHEPDISIADLVADRRASTPTAAAEAVAPDRSHVHARLGKAAGSMSRQVEARLRGEARSLAGVKRLPLFRSPDYLLGRYMQRWERVTAALPESPRRGLERGRHRLGVVASRPVFRRSGELVARRRRLLDGATGKVARAAAGDVEKKRGALERLKARAEALSPLAVLERGYSITFKRDTGEVVRSSSEVDAGAPLKIKLASGSIDAEVTGKE